MVVSAPQAALAAKKKADAAKAANKPITLKTSDEIIAEILSGKPSVDPTAVGTSTGTTISPLTNTPTYDQTGAITNFGSGNYQKDFIQGNVIQDVDAKGNPYVGQRVPGSTSTTQVYILGNPNDPKQYLVTDRASAINSVTKEYAAKPNGYLQLKQQLIAKKVLTGRAAQASLAAKNTLDKDLIKAIDKQLANLTFQNFNGYLGQTFTDFNSSIGGGLAGAVTTKTSISKSAEYTNAETAAMDITSFLKEYLGRGATAKEVNDYQAALKAAESRHVATTKTTVTGDQASMMLGVPKSSSTVRTGGGLSDDEKLSLKVAVVSKSLEAAGVDPSSISKSGGKVAQIMDTLKQNAAAYGLQYDDKMALNSAVKAIQPGADYKSEIEKMKQIAKVKYKNLASAIDAGTTVRDIADQFQAYKNKTLELAGPTDVFDPDIQKAINNDGKTGVMSVTDFNTYLRNKPEWAKTQNAREEAANYATTILKQFGFLG